MKTYLFLLITLLAVNVMAATEQKPAAPEAKKPAVGPAQPQLQPVLPRYQHITNGDGKILATIDSKDGSVDYKESCKDVVPQLLAQLGNIVNQCNQQIQALQHPAPLPVAEKKAKK